MHGLGPMILDAGINAGLAYLMYEPERDNISILSFPQPMAGDIGVTSIIEPLLTWLIVGIVVRNDMRHCMTPAEYLPQTPNTWIDKFVLSMRQYPIEFTKQRMKQIAKSCLIFILLTGLPCLIPALIALLILEVETKNDYRFDLSEAVICKAIYGGVMGLIITPIAAYLTMVYQSLEKTGDKKDDTKSESNTTHTNDNNGKNDDADDDDDTEKTGFIESQDTKQQIQSKVVDDENENENESAVINVTVDNATTQDDA